MTKRYFDPNRLVQTRSGLPARIICTDMHHEVYKIVALVSAESGNEVVHKYRIDGRFSAAADKHYMDLINVPLSPEEYVAKKGYVCPACGTDNIAGGDVDTCEGFAVQAVSCNRCGAEWTDDYTLTGYLNLETGEGQSE